MKENTELRKNTFENIVASIKNFEKIEINGFEININTMMYSTMFDGLSLNSILNISSTHMCNICGTTYKDFKDLTPNQYYEQSLSEDEEYKLKFSLPILHCEIKCMEFFLQIAYTKNGNLKDKKEIQDNKSSIQKNIKEILGLSLDHLKPGIFCLFYLRVRNKQ